MRDDRKILWFFLGLLLISCGLVGWLLLPFISIIVVAAVVTGFFSPIYRFLEQKTKHPGLASFITCIIIFFILFIPIVFFVGILSKEAYDLIQSARGAILDEKIKSLLEKSVVIERINVVLARFNIEVTGQDFDQALSQLGIFVGRFLFEQANSIATNVLKFVLNFFFMLLITFFLLIDGHKLISFITDLSPLPDDQDEKLIQKFKDMSGAILFGNGFCGLIQGVLGGIVFAIFGLNSAFLWGVIMGMLAFLPIVGIGAVFVPASLYLFLSGRIGAGLFFIIFYILLSGGIEYIFKPRVVGKRVQMHTLLVFLSIIGGLKLFGILGIVYGPLIVTAFLTLTDIYHSSYQMMVE